MTRTRLYRLAAVLFVVTVGLASAARAEVKLPAIFGDNMVLQRGIDLPVWGWAAPGEEVTVSFAGQTCKAKADDKGKWALKLAALEASAEGRDMVVQAPSAGKPVTLQNVLVGDVWVCSGQSNMQFSVSGAINGPKEIEAADYPAIRLFFMPNVTSIVPMDDCAGRWAVCSPKTVGGFTAVGYFFGRDLHRALGVPIGLIGTSWGGTVAEAWTSASALRAKLPEFDAALDQLPAGQEEINKAIASFKERTAAYNEALKQMYALEDDKETAARRAAVGFDDSGWKSMKLPGNWEERGHPTLDGIVWFRKTIDIPAAWEGKDIVLRPGPIDEVDQTWFNGEYIDGKGRMRTRATQFWNVPREYIVPGRLVKAGRNVIAIRVFDALGQGGLWGGPADKMVVELKGGAEALGDEIDKRIPLTLPLAGDWKYDIELALPVRPGDPNNPNRPSVLFNAMINPIIPFGIKGAIWYQGESNASRAQQYRTLLPTMITDWRTRWGQGDFTFLIVQLANFMPRESAPADTAWAQLREAQAMTAAALPKTGLALAIDIGDAKDIHPKNKQEVGRRLALAARAIAYGEKIPYSGPVYKSMEVVDGKAVITFDHADQGLVAKGGPPLTGFAIAGEDGKFVWAKAEIKGDTVVVWSDAVAKPVAVRYAWGNNPECNLYNGADLPAVPFRTNEPKQERR